MNLQPHIRRSGYLSAAALVLCLSAVSGCHKQEAAAPQTEAKPVQPAVSFFKVDPATAGTITGTVHTSVARPTPKLIDMTEDPACVKAHGGKAYDESLLISRSGGVENAFVYVKSGLEGKNFEAPTTPVSIDQRGCWFRPRVLGVQVGQPLTVINSDPVTHNIHPMAEANREWNHSQGPGDPPILRHFTKPEVMIPVKCNIHSWMHAYIGVLTNPYFAVTGPDGAFSIPNLPPGTYTLGIWQEQLGTTEQQVTVPDAGKSVVHVNLKGK